MGKENVEYTFENFVIGDSNRFAYKAVQAIVNHPAEVYNPLILYSNSTTSGVGKTHLARALYEECKYKKSVLYMTCSEMRESIIKAMNRRENSSPELLRMKYGSYNYVIIDGIEELREMYATKMEVFHIVKELIANGVQVLMLSTIPPELLKIDKYFRLDPILCAEMTEPDVNMRKEILKKKYEGVFEDEDIIDYIAENINSSTFALFGAVNKVLALQKLYKDIEYNDFKYLLKDTIPIRISMRDVLKGVADYFETDENTLMKPQREEDLMMQRHIAIYLCKNFAGGTYLEVSRLMSGSDATVVILACNKIDRYCYSKGFRDDMELIKDHIIKVSVGALNV